MTHRYDDKAVEDVLKVDAIADVEKIVGKHHSEFHYGDKFLALQMHMRANEAKARILQSRNDVTFHMDLPQYEEIIFDIGFRQVLELPFRDEEHNQNECLKVWWLDDKSILLVYDTYWNQKNVNGGHFGYRWKINEGLTHRDRCNCTANYSPLQDGSAMGSHDCREAVRVNIDRLAKCGEFITTWAGRPSMCRLLHYVDWRTIRDDHSISAFRKLDPVEMERARMLPTRVLEKTRILEYIRQ